MDILLWQVQWACNYYKLYQPECKLRAFQMWCPLTWECLHGCAFWQLSALKPAWSDSAQHNHCRQQKRVLPLKPWSGLEKRGLQWCRAGASNLLEPRGTSGILTQCDGFNNMFLSLKKIFVHSVIPGCFRFMLLATLQANCVTQKMGYTYFK